MSQNVTVVVSEYDYFEKALKAFTRLCHKDGIVEAYSAHAHWSKPSERRHHHQQSLKRKAVRARYARAHQARA